MELHAIQTSTRVMQAFVSVSVGGEDYLKSDTTVVFDSDKHQSWTVGVGLYTALFVFGYPVLLSGLVILKKVRRYICICTAFRTRAACACACACADIPLFHTTFCTSACAYICDRVLHNRVCELLDAYCIHRCT